MWNKINIILGSSSLMRKKILESYFDQIVVLNSKQKTLEVIRKLVDEDFQKDNHILITSDIIAVFNGQIREKPISRKEAFDFLKSYSNNEVTTISSIFVTNLKTGKQIDRTIIGKVKWNEISDEIINKIIDKGRIYDSCGGFSIEDEDLKSCICSIQGGEDNVKGLSLKDCLHMIIDVIHE